MLGSRWVDCIARWESGERVRESANQSVTVALIEVESSDGHRPPLQANRGADVLHDLIRHFVPALGAAGEDVGFAPPRKQSSV